MKVETAAEIVAKKLWHRGDRATARDLFDLSLVIEREPDALATAANYLVRHREAFLAQIVQRRAVLIAQFEAIDALGIRPGYDEAVERASRFLRQLSHA
ncbi:hypothetical protein D9M68_572360 [compost metagenome]